MHFAMGTNVEQGGKGKEPVLKGMAEVQEKLKRYFFTCPVKTKSNDAKVVVGGSTV